MSIQINFYHIKMLLIEEFKYIYIYRDYRDIYRNIFEYYIVIDKHYHNLYKVNLFKYC